MRLLDANVAIYANGGEHIYRRPCQLLMESVEADPDDYAIDVETLQGILHCYSRRGEVERGIQVLEGLLPYFPDVIPITASEITTAMRLMTQTHGLSTRHAIHAAVVFQHRLEGIVSADQDFDRIPGLRCFDPMEAAAG